MSEQSKQTVDELANALESILESVVEESGYATVSKKENRTLSPDQLATVKNLHQFAASSISKPNSALKVALSELVSCCDGFIADWEATGTKSAAVQQLIAILTRPHIRGLLWTAEDVSAGRFAPELPPVPFEVDEDDGIAIKVVRIVRREEPLGATIKCDGGKVFIARIIAGGVADNSACIQEGDRVLEVNGVSVGDKKADEIVQLLNRGDDGCVTFKLIPVEFTQRAKPKPDRSNIHLRALYNYDGSKDPRHPCPETALNFRRGDILELLVCNDEHWWQARCLGNGGLAHADDRTVSAFTGNMVSLPRVGLIPSELLQQKTKKADKVDVNGKGGTLTNRSKSSVDSQDELYYETVCRWNLRCDVTRPIVLIGPPGVGRPGEKEGVDYYFVSRKEMENLIEEDQMLEFGEFKGNLYGTALSSVRKARDVATPLLTPHPLALRHLRTAEFAPILIFVQPPPFYEFKETREAFRARVLRGGPNAAAPSVGRGFSDAEVQQVIENAVQLDRTYGQTFDARITNSNLEDSMSTLIKLLQLLETRPTWVPLSWATKKTG